jgi:hypothetical protein
MRPYFIAAILLASSVPAFAAPGVGECVVLPANNIWNQRIDSLPVDANSDRYVETIGADINLHPDFASGLYEGAPIGIPYRFVPKDQPKVPINFAAFGEEEAIPDESDLGPYPIPADAQIEGGPDSPDDRHVIVVQEQSCTLYELYKGVPQEDGSWNAVGAARFDLESNDLRPDGWTSADAAGLPIFPGLVRHEEVETGEITHALRFTVPKTRRAYVWPARHYASPSEDEALPPMGLRFRLKADVDISGFSAKNQVILRALQTYGMFLADNGSPWFLSGSPDDNWDNDELRELRRIKGSDFEAVDQSSLMVNPDSGEARAD